MIRINLMPARNDWRRLVVPVLMGLSFLGLSILLIPVVTTWSQPVRHLRVEEYEAVVLLTQRLERRVPDLAPWLRDFRSSVVKTDLDLEVRRRWFSSEAVVLEKDRLSFSPRFFDLDTVSQEQALLQALVTLRSQAPEPSEGIAYGE